MDIDTDIDAPEVIREYISSVKQELILHKEGAFRDQNQFWECNIMIA